MWAWQELRRFSNHSSSKADTSIWKWSYCPTWKHMTRDWSQFVTICKSQKQSNSCNLKSTKSLQKDVCTLVKPLIPGTKSQYSNWISVTISSDLRVSSTWQRVLDKTTCYNNWLWTIVKLIMKVRFTYRRFYLSLTVKYSICLWLEINSKMRVCINCLELLKPMRHSANCTLATISSVSQKKFQLSKKLKKCWERTQLWFI